VYDIGQKVLESLQSVAYLGMLFALGGRGDEQILLRTERMGIWGAVAPYSRILEAAVIWYKKFHFI